MGLFWVDWHCTARSWAILPSWARVSQVTVEETAAGTHGGCANHAPMPGFHAAPRLGGGWTARGGKGVAGLRRAGSPSGPEAVKGGAL
jgi:hypothetical protein